MIRYDKEISPFRRNVSYLFKERGEGRQESAGPREFSRSAFESVVPSALVVRRVGTVR